MARTVLFAWELGAGLGHLMQLLPLARELVRRGIRVTVAAREVSKVAGVFRGVSITILPAPFKFGPSIETFDPPFTFAHVLHNVGWGEDAELEGLVEAWRGLFAVVRPDVVLCDHSPTALLAARGETSRRVVIGSGFCCPPDIEPLPLLRKSDDVALSNFADHERQVLERSRRIVAAFGPRLQRLGQLYSDVDDTFLTTFRELDHYPNRPGTPAYRGAWTPADGLRPSWPAGNGPKVYAYLKAIPALPHLLIRLKGLGYPTVIFADGIDRKTRDQFACPTLRFDTQRPDMAFVARECDVAILNANHGTTASLLLAGKPLLLLPLFLEQELLAKAVAPLGAVVEASVRQPAAIVAGLERLLACGQLKDGARAFAARYASFDAGPEYHAMADRIEALL